MRTIVYAGVLALTMATATACTSGGETSPGDTSPGVEIDIAPLTLEGIGVIQYAIALEYNDDGNWVELWSVILDGNPYGDGTQYIGPCVAGDPGTNRVVVTILSATDTGGQPVTDLPPASIDDTFPCVEGADTQVEFDFTLVHSAGQGFVDVTYNIDEVFCSAKLDCLDAFLPDNSLTIESAAFESGTCSAGIACEPGSTHECEGGVVCPAAPDSFCPAAACTTEADCPLGATCDGVTLETVHVQGDRAPTIATAIACTGGGENNVQTEVGIHNAVLCCGTGGVIDPTDDGCLSLGEINDGDGDGIVGEFPPLDVNGPVYAELYDGSETLENKEYSNTAWQLDMNWLATHEGETCTLMVQAYVNWTEDGVTPPATTYTEGDLSFVWRYDFTVDNGLPFSEMCGPGVRDWPKPYYSNLFKDRDPNGGKDAAGQDTTSLTSSLGTARPNRAIKVEESINTESYGIAQGLPALDVDDYYALNLLEDGAIALNVADVTGAGYAALSGVKIYTFDATGAFVAYVNAEGYATDFVPSAEATNLYVNNVPAGMYYIGVHGGAGLGSAEYTMWLTVAPVGVDMDANPAADEAVQLGFIALTGGAGINYSQDIGGFVPFENVKNCIAFQPTAAGTTARVTATGLPANFKLTGYKCDGATDINWSSEGGFRYKVENTGCQANGFKLFACIEKTGGATPDKAVMTRLNIVVE